MSPELCVVVPMYNEEAVLPLLVERLRPVADGWGVPYEILCVDDGSTDATPVLLQRLHREWPQVRVLRLRANAGHQAAISAGLARARGDWMVTIDADLQDPPETIGEMLAVAQGQGVDVVYGVRSRPLHRHGVQAARRPGPSTGRSGRCPTSTPTSTPATSG